MKRMFVFGNEDWYNTVSYIFASDDEEKSVSKSDIINTFEDYYNKFSSLRHRNTLNSIVDLFNNLQNAA